MDRHSVLAACRTMITSHTLLVLATSGPVGPHTSLMGYAASQDARWVYMVTSSESRKWKYIRYEPRVSLLIDDRVGKFPARRDAIRALTITGRHTPVDDHGERIRITKLLFANVPSLGEFLSRADTEIIRVKPERYLLLDGQSQSYSLEVKG